MVAKMATIIVDVTGLHKSSDFFEYPKKALLKPSQPQKYLPKKSRSRKLQNQKKFFDHPYHLKSEVTHPTPPTPLSRFLGHMLTHGYTRNKRESFPRLYFNLSQQGTFRGSFMSA